MNFQLQLTASIVPVRQKFHNPLILYPKYTNNLAIILTSFWDTTNQVYKPYSSGTKFCLCLVSVALINTITKKQLEEGKRMFGF